jgi:hypothetical protein
MAFRLFYFSRVGKESAIAEQGPLLRITKPTLESPGLDESAVRLTTTLDPEQLAVLKSLKESDVTGDKRKLAWAAIVAVRDAPDAEHQISVWARVIEALRARDAKPNDSVYVPNSASWDRFGFSLDRLDDTAPECKPACAAAWAAVGQRTREARKGRVVSLQDFTKDGVVNIAAWQAAWGSKPGTTDKHVPPPAVSAAVPEPKPNQNQGAPPTLNRTAQALNVLLEGVPGVGKTFKVAEIVKGLAPTVRGKGTGHFAVTMHPATTYEEFVEGLRPRRAEGERDARNNSWKAEGREPKVSPEAGKDETWFWLDPKDVLAAGNFAIEDGFFLRACAEAVHFPEQRFVVLLDEFNRCNIPKVLGDLLTSVESSKRARWDGDKEHWDVSHCPRPTLPGSKRLFFVPDNVVVVATMNTSDRSVGTLDAALRRRFAFERVWPHGFNPSEGEWTAQRTTEEICRGAPTTPTPEHRATLLASIEVWQALNRGLRALGPDALLGHSYFYDLREALANAAGGGRFDRRFAFGGTQEAVRHVWVQQILPQLCEILDAHHKQRTDDLQAFNTVLKALNIGVSLSPPAPAVVHAGVHMDFAPRPSPAAAVLRETAPAAPTTTGGQAGPPEEK